MWVDLLPPGFPKGGSYSGEKWTLSLKGGGSHLGKKWTFVLYAMEPLAQGAVFGPPRPPLATGLNVRMLTIYEIKISILKSRIVTRTNEDEQGLPRTTSK